MAPPLPPSSSPLGTDATAGAEGMDFDALDFSFLDDEDAPPSAEAAPEKVEPKTADLKVDGIATDAALPAAGDDFDLAAWDATEASETETKPSAALVEPAAQEDPSDDVTFDAEFGLETETPPQAAPVGGLPGASDDPFADFRSPEPDELALEKTPDAALAVSFGDEDEADSGAPTFDESAEPAFALDGEDEAPLDIDAEETDAPEPARPSGPHKYLFDRSFDYVPPPPPSPEPEPVAEPEPAEEDEQAIEAEVDAEPAPEPEPEEPPPPPPPTFSEEELAAARASSYADGETAGLQTAMATVEARSSRALETILQQVPGLLADRQQLVTDVAHEAARLAYALVARMMPELARTYGIGEVEAVVRDSLSMAVDQPRLSIRLHPDVAAHIHPKLEAMALNAGFNGQINLLSDAGMGPSDVRIEWGDGGAERLVQRAWNDVTEIVRRSVADLKERTGAGVADESAVVQGYETASL